MSDCDCQKIIKTPIDDGSTVSAMAAKKPIGDGLLITNVASTTVRIFYALRRAVGQHNALITSTSLSTLCLYRYGKCNFF